MGTKNELIEIEKYLKAFGDRWAIAQEEWVKEIIESILARRSFLRGGVL